MTNREKQFFCEECQTHQPINIDENWTEETARKSHKNGCCEEAKRGTSMPAGLHDWYMANRLQGTTLIYAKSMERQVMWVRDTLNQVLGNLPSSPIHEIKKRYDELQEEARKRQKETGCTYQEAGYPDYRTEGPQSFMLNGVKVVSTHTSKSCKLPVYGIDYIPGLSMTLRDNFHNWQISVKADRDIHIDLKGVGSSEEGSIHHCYCEGFPEDRWSGNTYPDNKREFTITIWGPQERVYLLLWQIAKNYR